jgi:hypothetical protein
MNKYKLIMKTLIVSIALLNASPVFSADTMVTFKVPVKITNFPPRAYRSFDLFCGMAGNYFRSPIPLSADGSYEGTISMNVPVSSGVRDWGCYIGHPDGAIDSSYADTSKPQIYSIKGRF